MLKNNIEVATSKGKLIHCPTPQCEGIISTNSTIQLSCNICMSEICRMCNRITHEGICKVENF